MTRDEWNAAYAAEVCRRLNDYTDDGKNFAISAADADDAGYESDPDDPVSAVAEELSNWTNDE